MYNFKNHERKQVTIDSIQNESTAKKYGCTLEEGATIWMMVLGNVVNLQDAYYLEDTEGNKINGGFPVGYAKDEQGTQYMIELLAPGFFGAFKE